MIAKKTTTKEYDLRDLFDYDGSDSLLDVRSPILDNLKGMSVRIVDTDKGCIIYVPAISKNWLTTERS